MNRYIGIDLGTSSVKILLVRADGEIEKTVSREYPISYPHSGWSEQNPSDWYEKTIDGLKELLSETDIPINEIAEKAGFANPNYFHKIFKSYMDTSPLNYRKGRAN